MHREPRDAREPKITKVPCRAIQRCGLIRAALDLFREIVAQAPD